MTVEWLPLVTGPAAAVIGSAVGFNLSRARLSLTIDRIRIAPSQAASSVQVPVDVRLREAVLNFPEALPTLLGVTVPERYYVAFLEALRDRVEDRSSELENAERVASELRQLAAAEDFDKFIDVYRFHHDRLWSWAGGEALRGGNGFTTPPVSREGQVPFHEVHQIGLSESGPAQYLVRLSGVLNVVFDWDEQRPEPVWRAVQAIAKRSSDAVAYHVKQDLLDYCTWVRDVIGTARQDLEAIQRLTRAELERYARLEISVLVSNSGRSGVSLGSEAKATVFLKGYANANAALPDDVAIPMIAMTAQRADELRRNVAEPNAQKAEELSPVLIQAGETIRLIAISENNLSDAASETAIRAAYSAAERDVQLELVKFAQPRGFRRGNRDALRVMKSRKVLFRDLRLDRTP